MVPKTAPRATPTAELFPPLPVELLSGGEAGPGDATTTGGLSGGLGELGGMNGDGGSRGGTEGGGGGGRTIKMSVAAW